MNIPSLKLPLMLVAAMIMIFGIAVRDVSAAAPTPAQPQVPGAASIDVVEKLIQPFKFKDQFSGGWSFNRVEKFDGANIVFSLVKIGDAEAASNLFVWLTKRSNAPGAQAQSKNFDIICIAENGDSLSAAQKDVSKEIITLIIKNDTGTTNLVSQGELEKGKGASVYLPPPPQAPIKPVKQKSTAPLFNPFRMIWIILLAILAAAVLLKVAKRIKMKRGGVKQ